jgi:hypothetical protein
MKIRCIGATMTQLSNIHHTYHVLVTDSSDHRIIKWIGSVSLMPQENGAIYLDISFPAEADISIDSNPQSNNNIHRLSIDYTDNE